MAGLVGPPETWAPPQPVDVGSMAPTGAPPGSAQQVRGVAAVPGPPPAEDPQFTIKTAILATLQGIRNMKNDPDFFNHASELVYDIIAPYVRPIENIKHSVFDPVVTYTRANPKVGKKPAGKYVAQPKYNAEAQGGGAIEGVVPPERANGMVGMKGVPASTKMPVGTTTKAPVGTYMTQFGKPGMVAVKGPSLAQQFFSHVTKLGTIDENVSNLNTNVKTLLDAFQAANPAQNSTQNNEQEGGRRRRQTKAKRKGRGRTRR